YSPRNISSCCESKMAYESGIIKLNYLGDYSSMFNNEIFEYADEFTGNDFGLENHMTNPIEINILSVNQVMKISLTYSKDIFEAEIIENLIDKLVYFIERLLHDIEKNGQIYFTPSDFTTVDITQDELDSLFN
ncbi:MAG: hypothetical protein ACM3TR_15225, partial [Caulobacteraceae bacterium]